MAKLPSIEKQPFSTEVRGANVGFSSGATDIGNALVGVAKDAYTTFEHNRRKEDQADELLAQTELMKLERSARDYSDNFTENRDEDGRSLPDIIKQDMYDPAKEAFLNRAKNDSQRKRYEAYWEQSVNKTGLYADKRQRINTRENHKLAINEYRSGVLSDVQSNKYTLLGISDAVVKAQKLFKISTDPNQADPVTTRQAQETYVGLLDDSLKTGLDTALLQGKVESVSDTIGAIEESKKGTLFEYKKNLDIPKLKATYLKKSREQVKSDIQNLERDISKDLKVLKNSTNIQGRRTTLTNTLKRVTDSMRKSVILPMGEENELMRSKLISSAAHILASGTLVSNESNILEPKSSVTDIEKRTALSQFEKHLSIETGEEVKLSDAERTQFMAAYSDSFSKESLAMSELVKTDAPLLVDNLYPNASLQVKQGILARRGLWGTEDSSVILTAFQRGGKTLKDLIDQQKKQGYLTSFIQQVSNIYDDKDESVFLLDIDKAIGGQSDLKGAKITEYPLLSDKDISSHFSRVSKQEGPTSIRTLRSKAKYDVPDLAGALAKVGGPYKGLYKSMLFSRHYKLTEEGYSSADATKKAVEDIKKDLNKTYMTFSHRWEDIPVRRYESDLDPKAARETIKQLNRFSKNIMNNLESIVPPSEYRDGNGDIRDFRLSSALGEGRDLKLERAKVDKITGEVTWVPVQNMKKQFLMWSRDEILKAGASRSPQSITPTPKPTEEPKGFDDEFKDDRGTVMTGEDKSGQERKVYPKNQTIDFTDLGTGQTL